VIGNYTIGNRLEMHNCIDSEYFAKIELEDLWLTLRQTSGGSVSKRLESCFACKAVGCSDPIEAIGTGRQPTRNEDIKRAESSFRYLVFAVQKVSQYSGVWVV